ncbi:MAG: MFS transporter, partial [Planctomycetota bacterium]|nr:MFS transporter [Planctomycetota bacterium]
VSTSSDAYGDWVFGVAPIRDAAGEVAAVLEIGRDFYVFNAAMDEIVKAVLLEALSLLMVLVLLVFEFIYLVNLLAGLESAGKGRGRRLGDRQSPAFLARPIGCLFFTALSFPTAFVPLRMLELARPEDWLSPGALAAAAVSAQMLAFGLAVLASGRLIADRGAAWVIHAGFLFSGLGLILSWLAGDADLFLLANLVLGAGSGAGFLGIRSLLLREPDRELGDIGYSDFYSGMTAGGYAGLGIGSVVAGHAGYQPTFFVALLVMLAAWAVSARLLPWIPPPGIAGAPAARPAPRRGYSGFFRDRGVLVFLLFHIVPVYVLAGYVTYYFTVFAESRGMGIGDIGRLLLLHGLLVIYWGPTAARLLLPKLGGRALVMSAQAIYCLALVFFAFLDDLPGAMAALVAFGLVEGVSVAGANSLFLSLAGVKRLGEERAVAVAEMIGKFGETIGPLAFALALGLGGRSGLIGLAAIFLAAAALLGSGLPARVVPD